MANYARVHVVHRRIVKASSGTGSALTMSNLALMPQRVFCVYREPSVGSFDDVVTAFEARLPSLLEHFRPLTGRVVVESSSKHHETNCSNQGADFVVGEVGVTLASLDYSQLEVSLARIGLLIPYGADVALSVQLVSFLCGGFAVAWGYNDVLIDGGAQDMMASMWSGADNHCSVFRPLDGDHVVSGVTAPRSFVPRLYYVKAQDLAMLSDKASREAAHATRLEALSAYMWKGFAAVVAGTHNRCRMGWWVNRRPRLAGKAVMKFALSESTVHEIGRLPLPDLTAAAREAITSSETDAYHPVTPAVGLGSPLLTVSTFTSFQLDTDFGFGCAALVMPMTIPAGCSKCFGFVQILTNPAGDGSWFFKAVLWPRLAAAFDSDDHLIFKPLTSKYLGLTAANPYSRM